MGQDVAELGRTQLCDTRKAVCVHWTGHTYLVLWEIWAEAAA